jgi:hypothetical protein
MKLDLKKIILDYKKMLNFLLQTYCNKERMREKTRCGILNSIVTSISLVKEFIP